jgi:hypothetical protein
VDPNILNALRSLLNTGQRPEDLWRPESNKPGEDTADDSEDADVNSEMTMTAVMIVIVRVSERSTQRRLVAPTLPLSVLQMWTIGMTALQLVMMAVPHHSVTPLQLSLLRVAGTCDVKAKSDHKTVRMGSVGCVAVPSGHCALHRHRCGI